MDMIDLLEALDHWQKNRILLFDQNIELSVDDCEQVIEIIKDYMTIFKK